MNAFRQTMQILLNAIRQTPRLYFHPLVVVYRYFVPRPIQISFTSAPVVFISREEPVIELGKPTLIATGQGFCDAQ
jgi:hypothetical protein